MEGDTCRNSSPCVTLTPKGLTCQFVKRCDEKNYLSSTNSKNSQIKVEQVYSLATEREKHGHQVGLPPNYRDAFVNN